MIGADVNKKTNDELLREVQDLRDQLTSVEIERDRFRAIADSIADWEYWIASDGRLLYCSPACAPITGRSAADFLANSNLLEEIVHPEDLSAFREHSKREQEDPAGLTLIFRVVRPDGQVRWIEHGCVPVKDAEGARRGRRSSNRDITERKKADETLRHVNERLAMALRRAGAGMWNWDITNGKLDWSPELFELFDLDPSSAEASFDTWESALHPEDRGDARMRIDLALKNRTPLFSEYRIVRRDGQVRWISALGEGTYDVQGLPVRMTGICIDITEQKIVQEALRESEAGLAEAQRVAMIGNWSLDLACQVVRWSDELYRIFDVDRSELGGLYESFLSRVHPEDRLRVAEINERARQQGRPFEIEYRIVRRTGEVRTVREVGYAKKDGTGQVVGLFGTAQDITERNRTESALRASEERYRHLVEQMVDGMFVAARDGRYVDVNPAGCTLLGMTREEVLRSSFTDVLVPEEHHRILATVAEFADGKVHRTEWRFRRKDGSVFIGELAGRELPDGRLQGIVHDITDRKLAEESLREREVWLRGQREALEAAVNGASLETSLGALVRTASDSLGQETRAAFYLAKGEATSLRHVVGMPAAYAEAVDGFEIGPESLACGLATHHGRPILSSDVTKDPRWGPWRWLAERFGYRGCWSFPIHSSAGKFVGSLAIYSRQPREATERDLELAALLTNTASIIIARHTELEARTQAEERVRLLSEVTARLLASDNPQQIVESVCRKVMVHLGCDAFFNFLVEEGAARLRLNACAGIPEATAREIQWLDYGIAVCGCVARDGCRIVAEDIQTTHDPRTDLVRSFGFQAYACHPLMNQGKVVGTLSFGSRTNAAFGEDALALMKAVADHVAIAMQRVRLLASSQKHAQAAEAANVAKSQFLANMSHELRTPMTGIMGMTELALEQELPPKVREDLETVKSSADSLLAILNDILDFSRIESGSFDLEFRPFCLRPALDQTIKLLAARAYEKGIELACDLPAEIPDQLIGDSLRLRQVLTNLVNNAIKFTHKGEVIVRAAVEEQSEKEIVLQFTVTDTGIGIAPEMIERIFAPFTQADASTTRKYGGSGLGLTITKSLVAKMDGRIWVESQVGSGSTFHFTARLGVLQGPCAESAASPSIPEPLRDAPVLVVSNNLTTTNILEQMLARWSVRPESAPDVSVAVIKLHEAVAAGQPYRVVLAEAILPGVDGITLAGWINNEPGLAGSVILMTTPTHRQAIAPRCKELGAVYLQKPIVQADLLAALGEALGTWPQLAPPHSRLSTTIATDRTPRPLRILVAEDTPANQKIVRRILEKRGHVVEVADDGVRAVSLVQGQDFDVVLMDVQMPEMDGFQATAEIRALAEPKKARLPIIAMTAHAMKGDEERCLAAGMNAYIAKPINVKDLVQIVERQCVLQKSQ